ncbi:MULTISPECIES: hypothetical protein [unclassified Sphingobium]|uniref:hypothetical protein n=1 Tax=unclassified Sphingobium TaxID=2611147 RepID=UPI0022EED7E8|nr:hypothetical protein [Sphingobium sp. BS19]GLI98803.1 hypothetical protein Sbs19_26210 [Sphingobium sp. BS19]
MPYTARADGRVAVTIDSNVWDQFFALGFDLAAELPVTRFALFVPREIEIEIAAIPDRPDKVALKAYIREQMRDASVKVSAVFGFTTQKGPQRRGGFGFGTFQSEDARAFYAAIREPFLIGKPTRNSQLSHNEGDAALGAASLASVVLTRDLKKAGPLRVARDHGGKLIDMTTFDRAGPSLASLIDTCHAED